MRSEQLGRFLHDGQIRAEIGVKHLVKAQTAQSLRHLAGNAGADGQTEFLAQSHADSGSRLHDDELRRDRRARPKPCPYRRVSRSAPTGQAIDALTAE